MNRWAFAAAIAALVLMTVAFPLWQALQTGGYVFYMNGFDETTYLQYDFSKAIQGVSRPGQYLVTLAHEAGVAGGWINALSDALALVAFPLLACAAFRRLGWTAPQAMLGAIALVVVPALFGTANPLVAWIHDRTNASDLVAWLNTPEMFVSPLVRSPEPQFSLALLALATLAALAARAAWVAFPFVPFMYPFVGLPTGYVVLALELRARWPFERGRTAGPLAVAAIALGCGTWAFYNFAVGPHIRAIMIDSRLPLVSFTGLVAVSAHLALRGLIAERLRFFALALALAPWVASNQQLLSGHIPQPNNFEHYFGVFAIATIVTLALAERPRWAVGVTLVGALLFARTSYVAFRVSQDDHRRFALTPELHAALREDPASVVIDDGMLASAVTMLHAKQGSTALGFEQTYTVVAEQHLPRYRCVRTRILAEHPDAPRLRAQLRWLDHGYEYGSQDVLVTHIKRRQTFTKLLDIEAEPCRGDPPRLRYFWVAPAK